MNTAQQVSEKVQKKYGGVLSTWSVHDVYDNIQFVLGIMYDSDPTGRFPKHYPIRTSNIVHLGEDYVETANTVYALKGDQVAT